MPNDSPATFFIPKLDRQTLITILAGPLSDREYVVAQYTIAPKDGIPLPEALARAAIAASCRSQRPYHSENHEEWLARSARVKFSQDGNAQVFYPMEMFGAREGVSKLLAVLTCGGEHDFVEQFWLHDFDLPPSMVKRFLGPQFGIEGIRHISGIDSGPIVGVTVRPPLHDGTFESDLTQYRAALEGGADYLTDDILFSDNAGEWRLENRAAKMVQLCKCVEKETKRCKKYIVNLTLDEEQLPDCIERLGTLGVSMVKVNAFYSGFGTLNSLRKVSKLPLIATNIGVSLLTRPANAPNKKLGTGVAEAVISKMSRLCGADAIHLGSLDTGSFVFEPYDPCILALSSKLNAIKESMAVLSDNINVSNLWQNLQNFGQNVMLESSSGIMSFPGGPARGAQTFKKLALKLAKIDNPSEAQEYLNGEASHDGNLFAELLTCGYSKFSSSDR